MTNPVLAKVTFWDEYDCKMVKRVHLLNADSFANAAAQLEDYYGKSLEKIHLTIYEDGLITLPVNMYKQLNQWLSDGVEDEEE